MEKTSIPLRSHSLLKKEKWHIASIGSITTEAIIADGWEVKYQPKTFTMKHLADLIIQEELK